MNKLTPKLQGRDVIQSSTLSSLHSRAQFMPMLTASNPWLGMVEVREMSYSKGYTVEGLEGFSAATESC